jgi:hypothetical protein
MRRSNIHACPRRCACSAHLNHAVGLKRKNKTLNIHAAWPRRYACSAQPDTRASQRKKNMGRSNIHATRAALRVFSHLNSTQSALQQKKI